MSDVATDAPDAFEAPHEVSPPRHLLRNLLIGLNIFLVVCVAAVGGVYAYTRVKLNQIARIDLQHPSGGGGAAIIPQIKGDPFNVLLVGSDSRAFAKTKEDQQRYGTDAAVGGQRSDTMMVVRVDPKGGRASVLSIPRDLDVQLEGGGRGRINEAFASVKDQTKEDPARLIRTITSNLGISINHYMEVDFDAFRRVVDAVGGVSIYFPYPARDAFTQLNVTDVGCKKLDGLNALAYVRSRHYEFKKDGHWQFDPTGDLGRIQRQQEFIRRVVTKVKGNLTNPLALPAIVDAGVSNVKLDDAFSTSDLTKLANQMRDTDPTHIGYLSIPTEGFVRNGADLLRLIQPDTDVVLQQFGSRPLTATPSTVKGAASVIVLNATTTKGLAAAAVTELAGLGFRATAGGNANAALAATAVRFGRGADAQAKALAAVFGGQPIVVADRSLPAGQISLLVGADFQSLPRGAAPATTTTAAPAIPATTATSAPKGSDFSVPC